MRNSIKNTIQDIQDGILYKKVQKQEGFLSIPEHAGLILCADGVQLFKSSNQSFWPILLAVTNLPPGIRMNSENLILAGVWQGCVKPDLDCILTMVLEKLTDLYNNGILVQSPHFDGTKLIKAKLLLAVFDLPARASATKFVQFNGYYSCLYCHTQGSYSAHRQLFLPKDRYHPRSKASIEKHGKKAEETGKPVYGVKGISSLSSIIDLPEAVPVDYMHAALEGVAKKLILTCLDSKYKHYKFYIGKDIKLIDEALKNFKPPQELRRSPRSILTVKLWKASEFRAWLLYYSLPVLSDVLPSDYIYHLSLLVSSLHILLSDTILTSDVELAHKQLSKFYTMIPILYCDEICTANMHLLIHFSQFVLNWGPLWCYSCFSFESMNGHLRKVCHGTSYVLPQLVHSIRMRQMLMVNAKQVIQSSHVATAKFIYSMLNSQTKSAEVEIKSRLCTKAVEQSHLQGFKNAGLILPDINSLNLPICHVIRYNSVLYSSAPKRDLQRNGSICVFTHSSKLMLGSIVQFCFINKQCHAVIYPFDCLTSSILENIRSPRNKDLTKEICKTIDEYVHCVRKLNTTKQVIVVPVSSLFAKCVICSIKNKHYDYIIPIANMFEHH